MAALVAVFNIIIIYIYIYNLFIIFYYTVYYNILVNFDHPDGSTSWG